MSEPTKTVQLWKVIPKGDPEIEFIAFDELWRAELCRRDYLEGDYDPDDVVIEEFWAEPGYYESLPLIEQ